MYRDHREVKAFTLLSKQFVLRRSLIRVNREVYFRVSYFLIEIVTMVFSLEVHERFTLHFLTILFSVTTHLLVRIVGRRPTGRTNLRNITIAVKYYYFRCLVGRSLLDNRAPSGCTPKNERKKLRRRNTIKKSFARTR